jgi:hypothetical protein
MATYKSARGREVTNKDGLHRMPSGLIHTADSLAGGVHGTFVDYYGPPGSPLDHVAHVEDGGIGGKEQHAPALLKSIAGRSR